MFHAPLWNNVEQHDSATLFFSWSQRAFLPSPLPPLGFATNFPFLCYILREIEICFWGGSPILSPVKQSSRMTIACMQPETGSMPRLIPSVISNQSPCSCNDGLRSSSYREMETSMKVSLSLSMLAQQGSIPIEPIFYGIVSKGGMAMRCDEKGRFSLENESQFQLRKWKLDTDSQGNGEPTGFRAFGRSM